MFQDLGGGAVGVLDDDDAGGIGDVGQAAALQVVVLDGSVGIDLDFLDRGAHGSERQVEVVLQTQVTGLVDADAEGHGRVAEHASAAVVIKDDVRQD